MSSSHDHGQRPVQPTSIELETQSAQARQGTVIDLKVLALGFLRIYILEPERAIRAVAGNLTSAARQLTSRAMLAHNIVLKQDILSRILSEAVPIVAIVERLLARRPPPTDHSFQGVGPYSVELGHRPIDLRHKVDIR